MRDRATKASLLGRLVFFSLLFSSCQTVGYGGHIKIAAYHPLPADSLHKQWLSLGNFESDKRLADDSPSCARYFTYTPKLKVPVRILNCYRQDDQLKGIWIYEVSASVRWDYAQVKKNKRSSVQAEVDDLLEQIRMTLQSILKDVRVEKISYPLVLA